jgi:hypothetical protein
MILRIRVSRKITEINNPKECKAGPHLLSVWDVLHVWVWVWVSLHVSFGF